MSRILAIAWKDLRSTMRNVPALAMMLLAPLALAALLGFAFGGGQSFSISATKVAVANADTGAAGAAQNAGAVIVGVMKSPDLKDIITVSDKPSAATARKSVDDGKTATAVVIPADFSGVIFGTSSTAPKTAIEVYENPTQQIGGAITESIVGQALLGFNGARAAAVAANGLATANGDGYRADKLARQAAARYIHDGGAAAGVSVTQRAPQLPGGESTKDVGVTGTILAGMMIFFMFFGANNVARTILDEDRAGTLPRLFTTPTPRQTILSGKFSSVFVTVTVQAVILLVAGRFIFSIDWGRLDAVAALTLVAAAVASGLALLVISLVRTPAQAGAIGAGVYLVLALLGGNFTGTAAAGGTYAGIQKLTPNGWLLQGWDAVMRGGGLADIVLNLLIPLLFAVAFFAVAVLRFRKRYA
ncbi:MAG: ABC transporter permease [Actinobacteria bacterium]|nr:ABC transporter permease [Actinomycetota bacterium]